jgi:hypothetical protein
MQIGPSITTEPLKAGDQVSVSSIWTANTPGIHRISVIIDPSNVLEETDETNNTIQADIEVEGDAPKEKPPLAEKISDGIYRMGNIMIDRNSHEVTMPGWVNMQRGPIEYLACGPGGKLHESLLVLDVDPFFVHAALLLLGLEAGGNLRYQGDSNMPEGDPVEVWVQWEESGETKRFRSEQLILNSRSGTQMESTNWIFTGSVIHKGRYLAAVERSLIATYRDPIAIINNPLDLGRDDEAYTINADITPDIKTPIKLIINPVKAKSGQ